jgi:hypothetical protein
MSFVTPSLLNALKKLNTIPPSVISENFLKNLRESLIEIAEEKLQLDNTVPLPKYFRSVKLLAQQAAVYGEGKVYGPVTDKELFFILSCRFFQFYVLLSEHPRFKSFERFCIMLSNSIGCNRIVFELPCCYPSQRCQDLIEVKKKMTTVMDDMVRSIFDSA